MNYQYRPKHRTVGHLRTLVTYVLTISMSYSPLSLMAASSYGRDSGQIREINDGSSVRSVVGLIKSGADQLVKMKQNMIDMQTQIASEKARQQALQNNQPKSTPAKYFPKCSVPQAGPSIPKQLCERNTRAKEKTVSAQDLGYANAGLDLAKVYIDQFYKQMQSEGQNTYMPVGIQCLKDELKNLDRTFQDKINALENMASEAEKKVQALRDENNNLTDGLRNLNYQLNGGQMANNKDKSFDVSKQFNEGCRQALGSAAFNNQQGLRGVETYINNPQNKLKDNAANVLAHTSSIAGSSGDGGTLFMDRMNEIRSYIAKNGIQNLSKFIENGKAMGPIGAARMKTIADRLLLQMENERVRINNKLSKEYNYNLPAMDEDFIKNMQAYLSGHGNVFSEKKINDCVLKKDDSGLGISLDQIKLTQDNASSGPGGVADDYAKSMRAIWASDQPLDYKMKQIENLETNLSYGSVKVLVRDPIRANKLERITPYELFSRSIQQCKAKYQMSGADSTDAISGQQKTTDAHSMLSKFSDKVNTFADDLIKEMKSDILRCSAQSMELTQCSSGKGAMDFSSPSFCWSLGKKCAETVNSCASQARTLISNMEKRIQTESDKYNVNVKKMVAIHEDYLQKVKLQVFSDVAFYRQFFPAAKYELPEGLYVPMPELKAGPSELGGAMLMGGGSSDYLKYLPGKLRELKKVVQQAAKSMKDEAQLYIETQRETIAQNEREWRDMATECKARVDEFQEYYTENKRRQQEAAAKQKAMQEQEQQEREAKVSAFCQKYDRLLESNNPQGWCSDKLDGLFADSDEIANWLDPDVPSILSEYRNNCARAQSNKDDGSEDDTKTPALVRHCSGGAGDWDSIAKEYKERLLSRLPQDIDRQAISDYMDGNGATGNSGGSIFDTNTSSRDGRPQTGIGAVSSELVERDEYLARAIDNYRQQNLRVKAILKDNKDNKWERPLNNSKKEALRTAITNHCNKFGTKDGFAEKKTKAELAMGTAKTLKNNARTKTIEAEQALLAADELVKASASNPLEKAQAVAKQTEAKQKLGEARDYEQEKSDEYTAAKSEFNELSKNYPSYPAICDPKPPEDINELQKAISSDSELSKNNVISSALSAAVEEATRNASLNNATTEMNNVNNDNLCTVMKAEIANAAYLTCSSQYNLTVSQSSCIETEKAKYKKDLSSLTVSSGVNAALSRIEKLDEKSDTYSDWVRIGEDARVGCSNLNSSSRGRGGMLDMFGKSFSGGMGAEEGSIFSK
jgi:hypothetical protein